MARSRSALFEGNIVMRYLGFIAAAILFAAPAFAGDAKAPTDIPQLDARLAQMFQAGHIPGATVAIVENGNVTFAKGYGYADVAGKIAATADTPFRAGSISKAFTAIGIMTLVEQGKLSLDAKLADFAPEVHFVNPWEATNPVRLANLLEHTTGWPDIATRVLAKDEKNWSTLQGVQFSSADFVSRWAPGKFMVYNNAGPAVAALAMEKLSGKAFADYMRDAVLRPMGMQTADYDLPPDLASRIAKSYAADGTPTPYQYIVLKPAGSLNVSARELAQLVRFYLSDGTVDGHRILSPESVARIERSETNLASKDGFTFGYGLGNAIFPDSGPTFRGHNGSIDSFTSVMGYNRRTDSGYVLMANGGDGVDFATPVAQLVQTYLTRGIKMSPPPAAKVAPGVVQNYAGFYRVVTPPNSLLRPYVEILNIARVRAEAGKLTVGGIAGGNDFFPVSDHLFRRADREEPSLAFVEDGGRVYKVGAFNAAVKEPFWVIAVIFAVAGTCVLGAVVGLLMLLPWIYFAVRGRLSEQGGIAMRLLPLLSTVALAVTMVLPIMAFTGSGTSAVHQLADVGPYSLLILLCSVLFPLLALAGLVLSIRNVGARSIVRAYVGLNSLGLLAASAYLASIGWFAVRTWTM
jgi:CubicO group peptidase (beta-lactamase class C family)